MGPSSHLKYMLLGAAGLLAIGLLAGMSPANALYLAVLLACPLMMAFMMMGGHGHGSSGSDEPRYRDRDAPRRHD